MIIRPFQDSDATAWDRFVELHPHGSPFHLTAWKTAIQRTFGYAPHYLLAEDHSGIHAVLPLFRVKSLLAGDFLLSSPFAVYGGVLADGPESKAAMAAEVQRFAQVLKVEYVELRNAAPEQTLGFTPIARYVTFMQRLADNEQAILESIPRKTRRMVRKALEHDYSVRTTREPGAFTDLYTRNLRRLGTPSFPSKHFTNLLEAFGDSAEVREIVLDGKIVASVLSFYFQDRVLPYYGASDPASNEFAPNNFMYFDLMRSALARGCSVFDFGRSKKDSGSFDFKAHWGMETVELPYEILLIRRKGLPDYNPNNPRLQWFIQLWRRVPLPVTRALGPFLIRLVP